MATQAPETVAPPQRQPPAVDPAQRPAGFSAVARRVTGWTSNLLATALILVVTLATGRQVSEWLRAGPPASPDQLAASEIEMLGSEWNEDALQFLEFGDAQHPVQRDAIQGDRQAAIAALRNQCRNVIPTEFAVHEPVDPAERRLLARLASQTPTEQQTGSWAIFDLDSALPMVVVLRDMSPSADASALASADATSRRLGVCGIALPVADERWTLFTFHRGPRSARAADDPLHIPIPIGSSNTLTMRSKSGGTITAFSGAGPATECVRFYENWFRSNGWSAVTGWRNAGTTWYARYTTAQPSRRTADLHIAADGHGRLSGIFCTTPPHVNSDGDNGQ